MKSWNTKEWKDKRIIFLKDKICDNCKQEPATVVQHKWHPTPQFIIQKEIWLSFIYKKIIDKVEILPDEIVFKNNEIGTYIDVDIDFIVKNEHIDLRPFYVECCPYCEKRSITKRKTYTQYPYRCQPCKKEFTEPSKKIDYVALKKHINTYGRINKYMNKVYKKYAKQIEVLVQIELRKQSERYNSFADAVPYCKKCAFIEDCTDLILCQKCKSKYHVSGYSCCFDCLPEDRKSEIFKQNAKLDHLQI